MLENPQTLFSQWLTEATDHPNIREPTAMILATIDDHWQPSTRTVLLKGFDEQKFWFFTNSTSRKGREMAHNPKVAVTFYWDPLNKQIHLRGRIEKAPHELAKQYWRTRPRNSQLSQWISRQSEPVPDGISLRQLQDQARQQWENQNIPCPQDWFGYFLFPDEYEFWTGDRYRLHDRRLFRKNTVSGDWSSQQLFP